MPLLLSAIAILNLGLGLFVLLKRPDHPTNRSFFLFTVGVAGWTAAVTLSFNASNVYGAASTARPAYAMGVIGIYTILVFFDTFRYVVSDDSRRYSRTTIVFGGFAIVFVALSLTRLMIVYRSIHNGVLRLEYGPLYPVAGIFLLSCIGTSIGMALMHLRRARGRERQQLAYCAIALLIPGLLAVVNNVLVPLVTNTSDMSRYGPILSLATVAIIAHSIVRHHLLDLRIVIRRGAVYILAFAVSGLILSVLIYMSDILLQSAERTVVTDIALGVIVSIIFVPLKTVIERLCDYYLYRSHYHYQSTVRIASEVISRRLKLSFVLEYLADVIGRTMRPARVHIYLRTDAAATTYMLQFSSVSAAVHSAAPPSTIGSDHAVPAGLELLAGALSSDAGDGQPWASELRQLGADLAIPVVYEAGLLGFILLGPKLSGDAYFANDVDLLATITNQAGLAIKNVQLYRQLVLINEYLQNIVATIESGVVAVDSAGQITMFN